MFTRRHERELAEIKALTFELGQRFEEVLEQLEEIKEAQEQLAVQNQGTSQGAGKAQRKADRLQTETPGLKAVGGKKARKRQGSTPVVGSGVKPGKQGRASEVASSEDGGDDARKQRKKARRKQRRSEVSASAGSDEEPGSEEEQSGEESRPAGP